MVYLCHILPDEHHKKDGQSKWHKHPVPHISVEHKIALSCHIVMQTAVGL